MRCSIISAWDTVDIDPLGVELLVGDIRDEATAAKACQGVDVVIHLAAHTRVIESVTNPELNFEVNAKGTLNMLLAARHAGVKKFIFASTGGAILGEQDRRYTKMVAHPISPYGAGKLAGEAYCSAFSGASGLNTIALRFRMCTGRITIIRAAWSLNSSRILSRESL